MSVTTEATAIRPFQVDVPDDALEDLRRRIAATNWPKERPSQMNPRACRFP